MPSPHTQPEEDVTYKKAAEEEEKKTRLKQLFDGCRFFLSREVPREVLTFIIRCFGGVVSWEGGMVGSTYPESDVGITHQVVDRPAQLHRFLSRYVLLGISYSVRTYIVHRTHCVLVKIMQRVFMCFSGLHVFTGPCILGLRRFFFAGPTFNPSGCLTVSTCVDSSQLTTTPRVPICLPTYPRSQKRDLVTMSLPREPRPSLRMRTKLLNQRRRIYRRKAVSKVELAFQFKYTSTLGWW